MRDDPAYWDTLAARITATVRERRQSSWPRPALWAPALAAAAALMLLLANGRAPLLPANGPAPAMAQAPNIAMRLAGPGQAPSIVAMLREQP